MIDIHGYDAPIPGRTQGTESCCPCCGEPARHRECAACGVSAAIIDCEHYPQPRPISAGRADGSDGHHDYCTRCAAATDARLDGLRDEASAAGDYDAAYLCGRALDGDLGALAECAAMLADAEASAE